MTRKETIKIVRVSMIVITLALLFGYAGFRAKSFITGPILSIEYPKNGQSIENALVEISGNAKNISFLSLNGNKIFTDESGLFKEKILLSYGYNVITVEAKDRFGRIKSESIQLIYK